MWLTSNVGLTEEAERFILSSDATFEGYYEDGKEYVFFEVPVYMVLSLAELQKLRKKIKKAQSTG